MRSTYILPGLSSILISTLGPISYKAAINRQNVWLQRNGFVIWYHSWILILHVILHNPWLHERPGLHVPIKKSSPMPHASPIPLKISKNLKMKPRTVSTNNCIYYPKLQSFKYLYSPILSPKFESCEVTTIGNTYNTKKLIYKMVTIVKPKNICFFKVTEKDESAFTSKNARWIF